MHVDCSLTNHSSQTQPIMPYKTISEPDEYRREELIRMIEHSIQKLTLQELEALYYDMTTKNYISDGCY
jgi:hypothetical protein